MKKILNIILMIFVSVSTVGCDLNTNRVSEKKDFFVNKSGIDEAVKPKFNFDNPDVYATDEEKVVEIKRSNVGRKDPFLPMDAKNFSVIATGSNDNSGSMSLILGKSAEGLALPPGALANETAASTIKIKVNGILYDLNRSSAIVNVDGADYVVHEGDKIFKLCIKKITPDKVVIAYGNNLYKKGVGEGFTGDSDTMPVDSLENMYAGNKNSGYNSQKLPDIKFVSPSAYL